ncbi:MAG: (Fe-S)-binding protein [Candidatus Lokiarchaeota archaeon]|nr:(Fe-S)-binding protein [Candidatus Lokiarchaeota archaeon]
MNENVKKVVTTGPPVSGMFPPDQENLVDPDSHAELDYERCVQCGYCRLVCRVYNTTYAERDYAGGRNRILKSLAHKEIDFDKEKIIDAIYQCMLCGACRTVCPNGIDTLEVFQTYRHTAVKKGVMPEKLAVLRNSIVTNKNPFLESGTDRFNWCDTQSCNEGHMAYERAMEHKRKIESGELKAEDVQEHLVGYFVGCTSAYRNNELTTATSVILDKLGVKFIVFPDEECCGSVLFRTGLDDDAMALVEKNIKMIRSLGVKEVVFSCSGCYSTMNIEYNKFTDNNLGFELTHMVQFVPKYAKEHGIKIRYTKRTKEDPLIVTYHDPCHLGRYSEIYDEPRELIEMIEGVKLVEMKHNREMSWCCGAGGGVRALYGNISSDIASNRLDETTACWENINEDRLKEALETKAEALVSACVFCKNNLALAAKDTNSSLPVIDLAQILEDCEFYK